MRTSATLPVLLITFGVLWFMKSAALLPDTATLLALGLVGAGALLFLLDGLNKSTVVVAPLLGFAGLAVHGIDRFGLPLSAWGSMAMVLGGILMLVARSDRIPDRRQARRTPSNYPPDSPF